MLLGYTIQVEIVGFVDNSLFCYFISSKSKTVPHTQVSPFIRTFTFYVKSIALSDNYALRHHFASFDLHPADAVRPVQYDWACKVQFATLACHSFHYYEQFNCNIRTEKYFSNRGRAPFCYCLVVVPPNIALNGIRSELDNTHNHYTVFCEVDNSYLSFILMLYAMYYFNMSYETLP